jgi:hypothetical protein
VERDRAVNVVACYVKGRGSTDRVAVCLNLLAPELFSFKF